MLFAAPGEAVMYQTSVVKNYFAGAVDALIAVAVAL
jgi:hypothetical protein